MKFLSIFSFFIFFSLMFIPHAEAQLNNKPFQFRGSPDGGLGMSAGGKQAIINYEINGIKPENLLRSSSGRLVDVTQGKGRTAIVSSQGETVPSYKGTSFRGDSSDMAVGVFNAYFSPDRGRSSTGPSNGSVTSSAVVNTWTGRIITGGAPVSYSPASVVDVWTGMTYSAY